MLQFVGTPIGASNSRVLELIDQNSALLIPSRIHAMMSEYANLDTRIAELNELAQKAGID